MLMLILEEYINIIDDTPPGLILASQDCTCVHCDVRRGVGQGLESRYAKYYHVQDHPQST